MGLFSRRSILGLFGLGPLAAPAIVATSAVPPVSPTAAPVVPFAPFPNMSHHARSVRARVLTSGEPIVFHGTNGTLFTEGMLARFDDGRSFGSEAAIHHKLRRRAEREAMGRARGVFFEWDGMDTEDLADALAARRNITLETPRQVERLPVGQPELQPTEGRVEECEQAVLPRLAGEEGEAVVGRKGAIGSVDEVVLDARLQQLPHHSQIPDEVIKVDGVSDLGDLGPVLTLHANLDAVVVTFDGDGSDA